MKKKLTPDQQLKKYKKKFRILLSLFIMFLSAVGIYFYLNYDYLVFKHFITGHYIYTEALDSLYSQELKRDVKGKYYNYFDNVVISTVTKAIREVNNDKYTYLYIPERLEEYKRQEKEEASESEIRKLNEKTVYLKLTNYSKYTFKFIKDNIDKLKYKNIIIDLRDNPGGDISVMAKISDYFLPDNSIIAVDKLRFFNWTYKAKRKQILEFDNIVILQNVNSASSSENMIAALNDNLDNVTLIGEKTFGKGIGQYTLSLKKGFAVKATILRWFTPDGINIHGNGIDPDVVFYGDGILEKALEIIEKRDP